MCMVNIAKTIIFIVYFERAGNIGNPPSIRVGFDSDSSGIRQDHYFGIRGPRGDTLSKISTILLLTGQQFQLSCYLQVHMTFSRTLTRPGPFARRICPTVTPAAQRVYAQQCSFFS